MRMDVQKLRKEAILLANIVLEVVSPSHFPFFLLTCLPSNLLLSLDACGHVKKGTKWVWGFVGHELKGPPCQHHPEHTAVHQAGFVTYWHDGEHVPLFSSVKGCLGKPTVESGIVSDDLGRFKEAVFSLDWMLAGIRVILWFCTLILFRRRTSFMSQRKEVLPLCQQWIIFLQSLGKAASKVLYCDRVCVENRAPSTVLDSASCSRPVFSTPGTGVGLAKDVKSCCVLLWTIVVVKTLPLSARNQVTSWQWKDQSAQL